MKNMRISVNDFIAAWNSNKAELIDIRIPAEIRNWSLGFGLKIPANELPERLSELPRDKLLVVACPMTDRSNMARSYLASQGFSVKYLQGGLLSLMDRLKGGSAEDIILPE
ncbi:MAG: rhodanese-like domain-containing protein [gamma proteobacterium symbiont of Bathyaustriella thionipta]|nr:rhodanese-like domain-containing protein [gamma proteobacterium symbiont of Bathyaustriella thionipta]